MKRKGRFLIIFIVLMALLGGCGSNGAMSDMASMSPSSMKSASAEGGIRDAADYSRTMPSPSPESKSEVYEGDVEQSGKSNPAEDTQQIDSTRKLIYRVRMETETLEFDKLLNFLDTQTTFYGGYVESSDVGGVSYSYEERNRYATIIIRVPSKYLDQFITEIGELANITSNNRSTEDVTLSYIETESRLASLEIQRDKLLEWMEKAETVEDLISLESRLSEVRYELEYYGSILRNYDNLVEYSTITVNVQEVQRITPPVEEGIGSRMWSGLKENLLNIKDGSIDFSVWFVSSLPYLLIWAVVITAIVLIIRALYRKEKRRIAKYNEQAVNKQNSPLQMPNIQDSQTTDSTEKKM